MQGSTRFFGNSTAGNGTFINNGGSSQGNGFNDFSGTTFSDNSSAGNGTFINNGGTFSNAFGGATFFDGFFSTPTAADGIFTNNGGTVSGAGGGSTQFSFSSTAGNGTFTNNGATVSGAGGGSTQFSFSSTAGNGSFTNNGATVSGAQGGLTLFIVSTAADGIFTNNGGTVSGAGGGSTQFFSGTAGNGTFTNNGTKVSGAQGGFTEFLFNSTAANGTLIANGGSNGGGGGTILFADQSRPGTAHIEVFGNGSVDISLHDAPGVTINSIAGDGNVFLGANNLTIGSNNLSTTFACAIQDGGQGGGVGGSLTKIGTGTVDLTGTNTYTGNTVVRGGILQVDGSITSNTFVGDLGRLAGTGTVYGNVTSNRAGRVSPGQALGIPGTLTVVHNYTQAQYATLMIQIAGMDTGQFSVLNVMGNANLNGFLAPVLLNGFVPTIGDSFTFLNYATFTGEFSQIQHRTFDNGMLQWSVIYEANHAILTVEQRVPDQGSTFLLLTLGLLGLVTFRRRLLREQP